MASGELGMGGTILAIHGGAGTLLRSQLDETRAEPYVQALSGVLRAGQRLLLEGAPALQVVTEAVRRLEECELFNAGRGAVLTSAGTHELDASLMDGAGLRAGAVAGMRRTRNPVLAALAVLQRGEHLMYIGDAADRLAASMGLEQVDNDWFGTAARREQLLRAQAEAAGARLDHDVRASSLAAPLDEKTKFGTVGAVARDRDGHLAAATSTGGMTNKQPGRVGDSPIIGAGCYADDRSVAVSCTGTGEAFMRVCAAHELAALVRYRGLSLEAAARELVHQQLPAVGGRGGLIAIDAAGHFCLDFNTEGMYRGWVCDDREPGVAIF